MDPSLKQHNKPHKFFSKVEQDAIISGVERFGEGKWAKIINMFPIELARQSRVQIRGQWRVIKPSSLPLPPLPSPSPAASVPSTHQLALAMVGNAQKKKVR